MGVPPTLATVEPGERRSTCVGVVVAHSSNDRCSVKCCVGSGKKQCSRSIRDVDAET